MTKIPLSTNIFLAVAGVTGSLTLPEIAATLAGFGTFIWMLVQSYLAIQKYRASACSRKDCQRRRD